MSWKQIFWMAVHDLLSGLVMYLLLMRRRLKAYRKYKSEEEEVNPTQNQWRNHDRNN